MKIYIYCIYFSISNKYYVGQTQDMKRRMSRHLENKSLVGRALRKYNDWTIEILHTAKDRDTANLLEIEEIRHYNCVAPNGYNLTRGGDGGDTFTNNLNKEKIREACQGRRHTEEAKKKSGHPGNQFAKGKNLGNQFAKEANIGNQHAKGFKHTEEWCKNHSEFMQGNKNPSCRIDVKIKKLKTRINKLEQEIKLEET